MNIKKNIMKTMCAALSWTAIMGSIMTAYATGTIINETPMDSDGGGVNWNADEGSLEEIEVTYQQSSSYNVTIPKTITLDTTKKAVYSVKVTGDIDANERVHVVPVDGISNTEGVDFYMKDQTPDSKKADVVATVSQSKLYWNSAEVAEGYEAANNSVSAPDLTAGNWKGTFQVAINLETMAEHVHNYVDGKCDCGAIDSNHTHNYENGTCTICGKEQDPYEIAPATEYQNWRYRIDSDNQAIILERYNNTSATDVIVYGNYVINGTVYKTQISSNLGKWSYKPSASSTADYMFAEKSNIKTIIFSDDVDTSNCYKMNHMFFRCTNLVSVNFGSNFDTSNTTSMDSMFLDCSSLLSVDLSSFDTSNVIYMRRMFDSCYKLNDINFGDNFNTSNVQDMSGMFNICTSLTSLDLSNFDTSNVTDMDSMFKNASNLKTVYVTEGKWSTSQAITTNMFTSCGTSSVTYK